MQQDQYQLYNNAQELRQTDMYTTQSVIFEEQSILGQSVQFGKEDLQLEMALQDVDHTTYLVHDPAVRKTLMMKPKKRPTATKNDSKFRINSATTRRTL